jgi:hypothetical protein
MLRNMGEVAAIQTAIAWVSQFATATVDQVGTLIRAGSDYTRPKIGDPSGKLMDVVNYEPGTVIHMDNNRQFLAGPVGTGTAGFIQVEQAILRGCGARWRFPEYFSGDASNNNMASSIVAGSPFVVAVEGNQLEWGVFERAVAKKVLELCVESGRLSREQVAAVDVKVTPPAVALANREEEERLREMRNRAGVLSVTTWQQQVGLDPKHEVANFEAEARRKGAEESGEKTVGESEENCECEEEISEGMLKGKKFTGETRDIRGRRRCYYKGKQIHCDKLRQLRASSAKPGNDELPATTLPNPFQVVANAGQDKDLVLKGVPRDEKNTDPPGPDVTNWFAKDLLAHMKYRVEEKEKLAKEFLNKGFAEAFAEANVESFKRQAKYLMAPKWMDFGGPESGKGTNTVVVAGHSIRKNQLGNIEFMFIATLNPNSSKDIDSLIAYRSGEQGTYKHPYYQSNFGNFAGAFRADNLAAFGVGHGIARELQLIMGWDKNKIPTLEQINTVTEKDMETAIKAAFEKEKLTRWVNEFNARYGGKNKGRIDPDALYFIPEHGGFNTDSINAKEAKEPDKILPTSIEAFAQLKKKAMLDEGSTLDDWLKKNRENYLDPHGLPPK